MKCLRHILAAAALTGAVAGCSNSPPSPAPKSVNATPPTEAKSNTGKTGIANPPPP